MFMNRVPSIYSLVQTDEFAVPSAPVIGAPDKPVSEVVGHIVPRLTYATGPNPKAKRIRSFGDLQQPLVPDIDDAGWGSVSEADSDPFNDDRVPAPPSSDSMSFEQQTTSLLDSVLLAEWEDRAEEGLFRYDVTACPTKLVPGPYGFIAQCNEGRLSKKRPTEFRVDQVNQPWDSAKFNFTKALQKEVLFEVGGGQQSASLQFEPAAVVTASPNLVFINVSPIEYGHVLLVPRVLDSLTQLVDQESMRLALRFCQLADNPYFRMCYNSLGAYGTINHLHFQGYYLQAPFAVERAPTSPMTYTNKLYPAVKVSTLAEFPVRGLAFECSTDLMQLADLLADVCARLVKHNIPHNLFIADCGARVFLFPNGFAQAKAENRVPEDVLATQVDPASFEISGHIIMKRQQDYDALTQDSVWRLLSYASLSAEAFDSFLVTALGQ